MAERYTGVPIDGTITITGGPSRLASDGTITIGPGFVDLADAFTPLADAAKEAADAYLAFASTAYEVVESTTILDAFAKPGAWAGSAPYTMTVTWTRPRNPPIGELRAWAHRVSMTQWRRRSIASWRWLWRQTMAVTKSATFENVAINPGDGDTLTFEADGPVRYDIVMMGVSS
jgi:hypothetical protein